MQVLKKLNRILDKKTKVKFLILIIAIIIGALLETSTVAAIMPLVSILLDNTIVETNRYFMFFYDLLGFTSTATFLAVLTFLIAGLYVFRGIYVFLLLRVQTRFTFKARLSLTNRLLRKIIGYPYIYHTGKNLAELESIVLNDVNSMFIMVYGILTTLTDSLMSLFMLMFLVVVSPGITLGILAAVLLIAVVYFKVFRKELNETGVKRREANIGMKKSVHQALGGIKEVKLMRREDFFISTFTKFSDKLIKVSTRFAVLDAVPKMLIESVCFGGAFIIVAMFMLAGTDMSGFFPQLSVFVMAAFRILPAVSRTINHINAVINNHISVDVVYKSLFEEDEGTVPSLLPEPELPAEKQSNKNDIIVDNVRFTYPKIDKAVLENVSLIIPEKKSVAFVGPSGAGKTTLADVILGVLSPQTGGVFYSGKSVHHNFDWWCSNVGYIPQYIYLLDESVLENVAFGIKHSDIDIDRVWHALEQAQLAEFVRLLPDGIETTIGERGIRLSGGQRQRIGIARALYENPSILVLDEATSSLDNETEKAVMDSIEKLQGEKTMIIIAHRLSTIENCDIIYRVEDGKAIRER